MLPVHLRKAIEREAAATTAHGRHAAAMGAHSARRHDEGSTGGFSGALRPRMGNSDNDDLIPVPVARGVDALRIVLGGSAQQMNQSMNSTQVHSQDDEPWSWRPRLKLGVIPWIRDIAISGRDDEEPIDHQAYAKGQLFQARAGGTPMYSLSARASPC